MKYCNRRRWQSRMRYVYKFPCMITIFARVHFTILCWLMVGFCYTKITTALCKHIFNYNAHSKNVASIAITLKVICIDWKYQRYFSLHLSSSLVVSLYKIKNVFLKYFYRWWNICVRSNKKSYEYWILWIQARELCGSWYVVQLSIISSVYNVHT